MPTQSLSDAMGQPDDVDTVPTKYHATHQIGANTFTRSLSDVVVQSTEPDYYEGGTIEQQGQQITQVAEALGRLVELLVNKDVISIKEFEEIIDIPYQFTIHEGEGS